MTAADVLIGPAETVPAADGDRESADASSGAGVGDDESRHDESSAGSVGDANESAADESGGASESQDARSPQPGERVLPSGPSGENYLLVGTDSTLGLAADDPLRLGHHDYSRLADVMMVIRLRDDGTVAMMSIPRDLAVEVAGTSDIAGAGAVAKINSAYNRDRTAAARAARLIDTVEANLDITLQHFVEADFQAFLRLVDAVGGVQMTFDQPIAGSVRNRMRTTPPRAAAVSSPRRAHTCSTAGRRWRTSAAVIWKSSCPDGTWQPHGAWNDLARTGRQRTFMRLAADQVAPSLLASPASLLAVLDIAADHLATSDTLSLVNDGRRLAAQFAGIDVGDDVEEYELRVVDVHEPVRWSLGLDPARAEHNQRALDVFRGIGWDDIVESRVRVLVTGPQRQRLAAELSALGFVAEEAGDMPDGVGRVPVGNVVYLAPQGRLAAGLLASHLVPVPDFAGHADLEATTVILHTGDEPPRVDAGYRRVNVPTSDQLLP